MTIKTKPIANREPRTAQERVYGSIRLWKQTGNVSNDRWQTSLRTCHSQPIRGCQFCPKPSSRYMLLRLSFFFSKHCRDLSREISDHYRSASLLSFKVSGQTRPMAIEWRWCHAKQGMSCVSHFLCRWADRKDWAEVLVNSPLPLSLSRSLGKEKKHFTTRKENNELIFSPSSSTHAAVVRVARRRFALVSCHQREAEEEEAEEEELQHDIQW